MTSDLSTRQARLVISLELLREVLCLPDDTEIFAVEASSYDVNVLGQLEMYVRHPHLPALGEGEAIPTAAPTHEMVERPQTIRMIDWGLA